MIKRGQRETSFWTYDPQGAVRKLKLILLLGNEYQF